MMIHRSIPVSYTHLDVYKRQVWIGSDKLGWEDTLEEVVKQGTLTIGFIGLAECLKALIGEHHGESEKAQQLGLKLSLIHI